MRWVILDRHGIIVFAGAIFAGAALLFTLEPFLGRMILPMLGGAGSTWIVCTLFFQVALLAGYCWAHYGPRWLGDRAHAVVHLALLGGGALMLPPRFSSWAPASADPALQILAWLAASAGLPFVTIAATAPLMQRWFSLTKHSLAADPYPLYATSNAGCLGALLAYPFIVEPLVGLAAQGAALRAGSVALLVMVTAAAALAFGPSRSRIAAQSAADPAPASPTWKDRLRWSALAAVPASLFLGCTSWLTTEIAPFPLVWVVPLAIYLFTLVLAFVPLPRRLLPLAVRLQPFLLIPTILSTLMLLEGGAIWLAPLHLGCLFVACLVCHVRLAASRPLARHLTDFYLMCAVGGAAGGIFNALAAPMAFNGTWEYPLALALAALARPSTPSAAKQGSIRGDIVVPLLLAAAVATAVWGIGGWGGTVRASRTLQGVALGFAALAAFSFVERSLRFGLALIAIVLVGALVVPRTGLVLQTRGFFGVLRVERDGPWIWLLHGTTRHGAQEVAPGRDPEPHAYYHRASPVGQLLGSLLDPKAVGRGEGRRVGVVGLGAGTLAAYGQAGDWFTFFELDPRVVDIARNAGVFTYLSSARGKVDVVVGDARVTLRDQPPGVFDVIVVDAFGSDAVPVHLLTREAVAECVERLKAGGLIVYHTSNRHFALRRALARNAAALGLLGWYRAGAATGPADLASEWTVLAARRGDMPFAADPQWRPLAAETGVASFDDDRASLVALLGVK